jgi:plasmid stabilization system protein ParE
MTYSLRYSDHARQDIDRLYDYLLVHDREIARRAYEAIIKAAEILREFPFTGRKLSDEDSLLRELLVPFGSSGYVMLFEIEDAETVTILAIRHQREDDYH